MKPYYSKEVIKRFTNPKNFGEIKNADGIGRVGNPRCGDLMKLYIKIEKKDGKEIIKDVKFHTLGCAAAIATSSVITDLIKGKTLEEALDFNREEIVRKLGGLPPIKIHCSVLAADALYEAIYDYLKKKKREIPDKLKMAHQRIEKEKKEIEKKIQRMDKN